MEQQSRMSDKASVFDLFPWITPAFVQNLVENAETNKSVTVKSFNAQFAFKNGENFSSHMISLVVIFTNKTDRIEKQRNFLVKIAIPTDDIAQINRECHIYETEIEVYTKILPAVEKCFNSIGIYDRIAPRYNCWVSCKRIQIALSLTKSLVLDAICLTSNDVCWFLRIYVTTSSKRWIVWLDWIRINWNWLYWRWPNGMLQQLHYFWQWDRRKELNCQSSVILHEFFNFHFVESWAFRLVCESYRLSNNENGDEFLQYYCEISCTYSKRLAGLWNNCP